MGSGFPFRMMKNSGTGTWWWSHNTVKTLMPLNHTLQNSAFYVMCGLLFQLLSHIQLFCDPMHCSLPGSSVHVISRARILGWVAVSFSSGLS